MSSRTLEAISLALGEYDRRLVSHTISRSETRNSFFEHDTPPTESESVTYHTQRHRNLNPGDIAQLPQSGAARAGRAGSLRADHASHGDNVELSGGTSVAFYARAARAFSLRSMIVASSRLASNRRYSGTVSSRRVIASPGRKAATAPQARIA